MSADEPNWEQVNYDVDRLPVPGGWLYRTMVHDGQHVAMVFVPDPESGR